MTVKQGRYAQAKRAAADKHRKNLSQAVWVSVYSGAIGIFMTIAGIVTWLR